MQQKPLAVTAGTEVRSGRADAPLSDRTLMKQEPCQMSMAESITAGARVATSYRFLQLLIIWSVLAGSASGLRPLPA